MVWCNATHPAMWQACMTQCRCTTPCCIKTILHSVLEFGLFCCSAVSCSNSNDDYQYPEQKVTLANVKACAVQDGEHTCDQHTRCSTRKCAKMHWMLVFWWEAQAEGETWGWRLLLWSAVPVNRAQHRGQHLSLTVYYYLQVEFPGIVSRWNTLLLLSVHAVFVGGRLLVHVLKVLRLLWRVARHVLSPSQAGKQYLVVINIKLYYCSCHPCYHYQ